MGLLNFEENAVVWSWQGLSEVFDFDHGADGSLFIVGNFTSVLGKSRAQVAKITPNGSLDASFQPGVGIGEDRPELWDVLALPGGGCHVAGPFFAFSGFETRNLAKLNADGSVDAGFTCSVTAFEGLTLDQKGRLLAHGNQWVRLLPNGEVDPTFNNDQSDLGSPHGRKATVLGDGSILVGAPGLIKLKESGARDTNFSVSVKEQVGVSARLSDYTVMRDGRILVTGQFSSVNGVQKSMAALVAEDGTVDRDFAIQVLDSADFQSTSNVAAMADGRFLVVVGREIRRFLPDGNQDPEYYSWVGGSTEGRPGFELPFNRLEIGPGGKIYAAAYEIADVRDVGSQRRRRGLGRIESAILAPRAAPASLNAAALSTAHVRLNWSSVPNATRYVVESRIGSSGDWTVLGRIEGTELLLSDLEPEVNVTYRVRASNGGGTSLTGAEITASPLPHQALSPASLTTGFNPRLFRSGDVRGGFSLPDGSILIFGEFSFVSGIPVDCVARVLADGTCDARYGSGLKCSGPVECGALDNKGRLLIGGAVEFTTPAGNKVRGAVRILADGTVDESFLPNTITAPQAMVADGDGRVVVVGWFISSDGAERRDIRRVKADGSPDPSFGAIFAVRESSGGKPDRPFVESGEVRQRL